MKTTREEERPGSEKLHSDPAEGRTPPTRAGRARTSRAHARGVSLGCSSSRVVKETAIAEPIAASTMFDKHGVKVSVGCRAVVLGEDHMDELQGKVGYVHKISFDDKRGGGPEALIYDIPTTKHYTKMTWGSWCKSTEMAIVPAEAAS